MKGKNKKKWLKRVFIFFSSLLILTTVLGIIFNQVVFMIIFQLGYSKVYNGNNEMGNDIMDFAISKMKNPDAKIFHARSVQNTKNGNYDIAIEALNKSYEMNPNEAGAYYGWVLLYYYHDYNKAIQILNVYDDSTPSFSDWPMGECIHYLKGLAYKELGKYDMSLKEFNISIKNTINKHSEDWIDYQVFVNKGLALYHMNRYDDAIVVFDKAINNYNKCSEAFYYKGLSEIKLGNEEIGCEQLQKANSLINSGYKSMDTYVELFHEIYLQQVEQTILENCVNQ
jgi:tetratricopeptide (TPR) repeat protein